MINIIKRIIIKAIAIERIVYAKYKFKNSYIGKHVMAFRKLIVLNSKYISVGDDCFFGPNCRVEAWDRYNNNTYFPEIVFGKDVRINSTCHVGAINKIVIGDQTLIGSHVMIIDHSHGCNSYEELDKHPSERDLYSKGEIVIGKRCWICENVVVLPNVHIGDGCVVGANSVVTKDVPPYSVVCGNPARVVKVIKSEN